MEAFIFWAKGHGKLMGVRAQCYTRGDTMASAPRSTTFLALKPAFFPGQPPASVHANAKQHPLQRPQRHPFVEH